MSILASDKQVAIVGLGKTGLSCVRHLLKSGRSFSVTDTRETAPGLNELKAIAPEAPIHLGGIRKDWLEAADEIWLSPGVAKSHVDIEPFTAKGKVRGDVDVFSREAKAPIVAVTGSNGKSTVTSLLGCMAEASGRRVAVGGNIGTPVLDLLSQEVELYVVELSSFQLETTKRLGAASATVLNVSEDHMDRYDDMLDYHRAKLRVYFGCRCLVLNKDDVLTQPPLPEGVEIAWFSLKSAQPGQFGILQENGEDYLSFDQQALTAVSELRIKGRHNWSNALAALALARSVRLPMDACVDALKDFSGLPHRSEWVAEKNGVAYVNDSKATNVGAAQAALEGLGPVLKGKIVLIAGGQGKDQDFAPLRNSVKKWVKALVLLGEDAEKLNQAIGGNISVHYELTLEDAIKKAASIAEPGDLVLLSPACASFDMFADYEHRGRAFVQGVHAL